MASSIDRIVGEMHPVPYEESAVARLLKNATRVDGHPPFSGHKRESIGGDRCRTGAWSDETAVCVVGVAAFHEASDHWAVEIAVAPDRRSPRMEEAAIHVATRLVPDPAAFSLWAFRTGQIEAATRLGYREARAVIRMAGPVPGGLDGVPNQVTISEMAPGDVGGIVTVNNRAFLDHPEQGGMTEGDFDSLSGQAWFDPAGVRVARVGEQVIGFCITKCEGDGIGEIFVIAVDPGSQRSGIGRALIDSGFAVLRRRGARKVNLWVDSSNTKAVLFYASFGLAEDFRTSELALAE